MDNQYISKQPIQTEQSVYKPPSNRIPLIIGILLLLILVGTCGYYLGVKQTNEQLTVIPSPSILLPSITSIPTQIQITTIKPTTVTTVDETVGWRTVSNKYWDLKIPSNWHDIKCTGTAEVFFFAGPEISVDSIPNETQCEGGGYKTLTIFRDKQKTPIPVSIPQDTADPNKYFITVTNKRNIQLDAENAVIQDEKSYPFGLSKPVKSIGLYIQKQDYTDSIVVADTSPEIPDSPPFSETTKIYYQILSTFKFQ